MNTHIVSKGCDIPMQGSAEARCANYQGARASYNLGDFPYLKPKLAVQKGDRVRLGQTLFADKKAPEIVFPSPVCGVIEEIVIGERRALLQVIIRQEGEDSVEHPKLSKDELNTLNPESARKKLLERGLWPMIRMRPFNKVAQVADTPACIMVTAVDSAPLAPDIALCLEGRAVDFQLGLDMLARLGSKVHLCVDANHPLPEIFSGAKNCETTAFAGPHPRGSVSVHIDAICPVGQTPKTVWFVRAEDVAAIGRTLSSGRYDAERVFAWSGPAATGPMLYRSVQGCSLEGLGHEETPVRLISGNALCGKNVTASPFLGYYDRQVTVLEENRRRKVLGWLAPGAKTHSLSRIFLSSLMPGGMKEFSTSRNGDHRALVDSEIYDRVQPLEIPTAFLYKAVLAGDIDEAEKLGLWSVAPEDFALASYVCPSKTDFCEAFQNCFDQLYREG
ncbi:MAG: NADH:ubiquinone reductase (Na(+)-transporting) subunit A [Planctomycetes bacterium]|nr:NADH:ubiquinone reductase (Na(+)-transporting) subunit A [Planctomycetota bacterium]